MLRTLDRAIDLALVLALATIVLVLVTQVTLRYLLNAPLAWPEELSQFLLVGISFFGTFRAFRQQDHIRIRWLPKGPMFLRLLRVGGLLTVAVFLLYIGYGGFSLAMGAWNQPSTALRLPLAFPYMVIPLTCALSLLAVAVTSHAILTGREDEAKSPSKEDVG
jgi:TRAP-type C4-dicarboxylate transport system permease small subunit